MSQVRLRRWTRQEYDRMIAAGVLTQDDHVELIDGEVVIMPPQKGLHATAVRKATEALRGAFGDGFDVRSRLPLALGADSEPEPDVTVVTGSIRDYRDAHPTKALLVLEVSDATLSYDRTKKAGMYARAGVADYWLVNLLDHVVEVRRFPAPSSDSPDAWGYAVVEQYATGEQVAPLERPDYFIAVAALLP